MTKNPYINAVCAALYIAGIATILQIAQHFGHDKPDTILAPMAFLSLFVLSATAMGTIFFFKPVQMYLDNEKKEAVALVLKTIGTFAVFTALFMVAAFITL